MTKRSYTFVRMTQKCDAKSCIKNPRNDFNSLRFNNLLFQITNQMKQGSATSM